jgi:pyruvate,orthophosphate dikinase
MRSTRFFGFGQAEGSASDKNTLGGKGANLCEMVSLGVPVPPGVIIPTSVCLTYLKMTPDQQKTLLVTLAADVIDEFEKRVVSVLGYMPLVSVRSGARVSMPGMMDTILNVGLTHENAIFWKQKLGQSCYSNCLVRLADMYTKTVEGPVPATFQEQLAGAIGAVFNSWNSERAKEYRRLHGYPNDWGTAVTVQTMVFGNLNDESCTGVMFSRDPATGAKVLTGEFLPNAQGEDVVAGTVTPRPIGTMSEWHEGLFQKLYEQAAMLESHYRDMQDIEFTIQDGELWILQTRNAKRTAHAAFKVAYDLVQEGVITQEEAVRRVTYDQYRVLKRPQIDPNFKHPPSFVGLPASPGVAKGVACFDPKEAIGLKGKAILIRKETTPDDFPGMAASVGILTATGGATSHAAVVARGMNKPAVVGATNLTVNGNAVEFTDSNDWVVSIQSGDQITIDGATGRVWYGVDVPVLGGVTTAEAAALIDWAAACSSAMVLNEIRKLSDLPTKGTVYLSVRAITSKKAMRELFKALAAHKDLNGVIGFQRTEYKFTPEDLQFLKLLGLETGVDLSALSDDAITALMAGASLSLLPKKLRKRWAIHLPMSVSDDLLDQVTQLGWKVVRPVRVLKDLLAADGYIELSVEFEKQLATKEGVTFEDALKILERAGREVTLLPKLVEKDALIEEALGK